MNECPDSTIYGVISALAAVSAALFAFWLWRNARKTLFHHILSDIQRDYRSAEMLHAISRLRIFYKKHEHKGDEVFVDVYEEIRKADEESEKKHIEQP